MQAKILGGVMCLLVCFSVSIAEANPVHFGPAEKALFRAVRRLNSEEIQTALKANPRWDALDSCGKTVLEAAFGRLLGRVFSQTERAELVLSTKSVLKLLLESGADINQMNGMSLRSSLLASLVLWDRKTKGKFYTEQFFSFLLENDADPGTHVLHSCWTYSNLITSLILTACPRPDLIPILIQYGADLTPLFSNEVARNQLFRLGLGSIIDPLESQDPVWTLRDAYRSSKKKQVSSVIGSAEVTALPPVLTDIIIDYFFPFDRTTELRELKRAAETKNPNRHYARAVLALLAEKRDEERLIAPYFSINGLAAYAAPLPVPVVEQLNENEESKNPIPLTPADVSSTVAPLSPFLVPSDQWASGGP